MRFLVRPILALLILLSFCTSLAAPPTVVNHITGLPSEAKKNAEERLKIKQQSLTTALTENELTQFYQDATQEIKEAIKPYGYFKAEVISRVRKQGKLWDVFYRVTPGPQVHFNHVQVNVTGEGSTIPAIQQLIKKFPLHKGDAFNSHDYQEAKRTLLTGFTEQGFLQATFTSHEIQIDLDNNSAQLVLTVDSGARYYFGGIKFSPNPLQDAFLQRYAPFKEGDVFSEEKLQLLQEYLSSTVYFRQVSVAPQLDNAQNNIIPIYVTVDMQEARTYSLGAGYGTDTGVRGLAGVTFRYLTSTGHTLTALIKASQRIQTAEVTYAIPAGNPVTDRYELTAKTNYEQQVSGRSKSQNISANYISDFFGWQRTIGLIALSERSTLINQPTVNSTLLIPHVKFYRSQVDDPIRPVNGYRFSVDTYAAAQQLLSSASFLQVIVDGKYLHSLGENGRLIVRGSLGYTWTESLNSIPLSLQLFAGGTQSVRGYEYKSIGPGTQLTVGSVEYRHRIVGNWFASVFYDAGSVSDKLLSPLREGLGAGVVWLSPIGAIEATVTRAISEPNKPWVLQFSMGSDL